MSSLIGLAAQALYALRRKSGADGRAARGEGLSLSELNLLSFLDDSPASFMDMQLLGRINNQGSAEDEDSGIPGES